MLKVKHTHSVCFNNPITLKEKKEIKCRLKSEEWKAELPSKLLVKFSLFTKNKQQSPGSLSLFIKKNVEFVCSHRYCSIS